MPVPPHRSEDSARAVGDHVPSVADCVRKDSRTDHFEQHALDAEMEANLHKIRHGVIVAELEPSLQQQNGRQGAWDQQQIVEV